VLFRSKTYRASQFYVYLFNLKEQTQQSKENL